LGLGIGVVLVLLTAEFLRPFAFEIGMMDATVAISTASVLLIALALGAVAPAWRAARVSPAEALRE
jgi:ABC-type antimicrobial peptide transport system permease subunit